MFNMTRNELIIVIALAFIFLPPWLFAVGVIILLYKYYNK